VTAARRVALVTGGSRGIGRATALALARGGFDVAVNYRETRAAADEVVAEIRAAGRRAVALQADVGEATEARGLVAGTVEHLGRLDVLVSNAGVIEKAGVLELTEETWDRLFRVNVRGAFFCAQAAARHLAQAGSGRIIFVASTAALMAEPQLAAYAGAKGALLSLTRAMALELAPHQVTVNAVVPGTTVTGMTSAYANDPEALARVLKRYPLGRLGRPEDTAAAIAFLASEETGWITGQTLVVDGGCLINNDKHDLMGFGRGR
jgi:3-oxoacyl-[acyl-carrier protein] reductase